MKLHILPCVRTVSIADASHPERLIVVLTVSDLLALCVLRSEPVNDAPPASPSAITSRPAVAA